MLTYFDNTRFEASRLSVLKKKLTALKIHCHVGHCRITEINLSLLALLNGEGKGEEK